VRLPPEQATAWQIGPKRLTQTLIGKPVATAAVVVVVVLTGVPFGVGVSSHPGMVFPKGALPGSRSYSLCNDIRN
jgi:hypothetical protein